MSDRSSFALCPYVMRRWQPASVIVRSKGIDLPECDAHPQSGHLLLTASSLRALSQRMPPSSLGACGLLLHISVLISALEACSALQANRVVSTQGASSQATAARVGHVVYRGAPGARLLLCAQVAKAM